MADQTADKMADLATKELQITLLERIQIFEMRVLREFRKWAMRVDTQLKVDSVEIAALKERIEALEEAVDPELRGA